MRFVSVLLVSFFDFCLFNVVFCHVLQGLVLACYVVFVLVVCVYCVLLVFCVIVGAYCAIIVLVVAYYVGISCLLRLCVLQKVVEVGE